MDQRNYVDINHGGAPNPDDNGERRAVFAHNRQRVGDQPDLAHHQLIIVRGLEANENLPEAARRSR